MSGVRRDLTKLERLVGEALIVAKWDKDGNPSWDALGFSLRHPWLAEEIMSLSCAKGELARLKSSKHRALVENVLKLLRKSGKSDATSIVDAIKHELEVVAKEPICRYSVVFPLGFSPGPAGRISKKFRIDDHNVLLLDVHHFLRRYLPKRTEGGRKVADTRSLENAGFDWNWVFLNNPAFVVCEAYARDSRQVVLEAAGILDLFLAAADLSTGFTLLERYPLSNYPNPTLCLIFKNRYEAPHVRGRCAFRDLLSPFAFNIASFSRVVRVLNSLRGKDVWPVVKASLRAYRKAMYQLNPEDSLVHFWTACEIIVSLGQKVTHQDAEKLMARIFENTWYEYSFQVQTFLNLRNKTLHAAVYDAKWHDVFFGHFAFRSLITLLMRLSRRGEDLKSIRQIFEAGKLTKEQREATLKALRELTRKRT